MDNPEYRKSALTEDGFVYIGDDDRCFCDGATPCLLGRIGSAPRCTESELNAAGYKTKKISSKKHYELFNEYRQILSIIPQTPQQMLNRTIFIVFAITIHYIFLYFEIGTYISFLFDYKISAYVPIFHTYLKFIIVICALNIFAIFDYLLHSRVLQEAQHRLNLPEVDPEMNYAYRITQVLFQVCITLLLFIYFGYAEALLFTVFWLGGIADGLYYVYEGTDQYFKINSNEDITWMGWTFVGWFSRTYKDMNRNDPDSTERKWKKVITVRQFVYQIWVTAVLGTIGYFIWELI